VAISWVNVTLGVIGVVANFILLKISYKYIYFSLSLVNKSVLLMLLSFGFFTIIRQIGGLLRTNMDAAIIGRYIGTEAIGVYSVAALLFGYLTNIVVCVAGATQPKLASIAGYGEKRPFVDSIMRYSVIVSNFSAGIGLVALFLTGDFLKLWVPNTFKDVHATSVVFTILLIGLVPHLMSNVSINALEAVNKHRYYAYQTVIEGIVNLGLSILLVGYLGIYGVALGTTIPILITKLIVQPIYCCKIIGIKWRNYMMDILIKPILLTVVLGIFLRNISLLSPPKSYLILLINGMFIFLVFNILSFVICFNRKTREIVLLKCYRFLRGLYLYIKGVRRPVAEENRNFN
jgi:O-antigen/teichoic acid export membrane protein